MCIVDIVPRKCKAFMRHYINCTTEAYWSMVMHIGRTLTCIQGGICAHDQWGE